jgi:hypothetical protein
VQLKCEEGGLNPERDFSGEESHLHDSSAESPGSIQSREKISSPVPTQLSLNLTPKTGTVPVVEDRRGRKRRQIAHPMTSFDRARLARVPC